MGQAGLERSLPGGVLAGTGGEHLAENDFIHFSGIEARLLQQAANDQGAEFRGGNLGEAALEGTNGGTGGGDDDNVLHGNS